MNDFKMNPVGLAKRLPNPNHLVYEAHTRRKTQIQEPSRFQKDTDFQVEVSDFNRKSEGLVL